VSRLKISDLKLNDSVEVRNVKKKNKLTGTVLYIGPKFLTIKMGYYRETYDLVDLRKGQILIFKDGEKVEFEPLPDQMQINREQSKKIIQKYNITVDNKGDPQEEQKILEDTDKKLKGEVGMKKKLDIPVEGMMDICREHGTGVEAARIVSSKFGITLQQAKNQIYWRKIKDRLEAEKERALAENKNCSEHTNNNSEEQTKPETKLEENKPSGVSPLASDIAKELKAVTEEYQNKAAAKKSTLKPIVLKSTVTGCEYSFCPDGITVVMGTAAFALPYGIIDTFAAELLDLKVMKEADCIAAS
jgi:hypothetical protein